MAGTSTLVWKSKGNTLGHSREKAGSLINATARCVKNASHIIKINIKTPKTDIRDPYDEIDFMWNKNLGNPYIAVVCQLNLKNVEGKKLNLPIKI